MDDTIDLGFTRANAKAKNLLRVIDRLENRLAGIERLQRNAEQRLGLAEARLLELQQTAVELEQRIAALYERATGDE